MKRNVDCLVLGAGPAGMAAACAARACGLDVTVVDENATPGGQLFRNLANPDVSTPLDAAEAAAGRRLIDEFLESGAEWLPRTTVWGLEAERPFRVYAHGADTDAEPEILQASCVILAPGAMERPVPFPGWTLPGVMGAGAAEILLRSGGTLPEGPLVLAGNGPLLPLLASHLAAMGRPVAAWLDTGLMQARARALPHLPAALLDLPYLRKGLRMGLGLMRSGIPLFRNAGRIKAEGSGELEAVSFESGGTRRRLEARLLICHEGIIPRWQLASTLGVPQRWDTVGRCWTTEAAEDGATVRNGIYVAGDATCVDGGEASILKGELAGIAVAAALGIIDAGEARFRGRKALARLRRTVRARAWINRFFAPNPAIYQVPDETLVCRCECVTAGAIRAAVAQGFHEVNEIKRVTRCGMGQCQGRICGPALTEIAAAAAHVAPQEAGRLTMRQPLRPVSLAEYCAPHR
ncbi:MAG: FAD-dependent oxidoreductase [Desulfovibrio sp.]|nr:FAD-dependent oxidoreductase [Desulfovibrio sp.]